MREGPTLEAEDSRFSLLLFLPQPCLSPPRTHMPLMCGSRSLSETLPQVGQPQCCQMAKFDSFLSLDCARVEGGGRKERKGLNFAAQHSGAIV